MYIYQCHRLSYMSMKPNFPIQRNKEKRREKGGNKEEEKEEKEDEERLN